MEIGYSVFLQTDQLRPTLHSAEWLWLVSRLLIQLKILISYLYLGLLRITWEIRDLFHTFSRRLREFTMNKRETEVLSYPIQLAVLKTYLLKIMETKRKLIENRKKPWKKSSKRGRRRGRGDSVIKSTKPIGRSSQNCSLLCKQNQNWFQLQSPVISLSAMKFQTYFVISTLMIKTIKICFAISK